MLTGLLPFDDKNPKEALEKTVHGAVDYNHPALVSKSKNLIILLKGLLENRPKDRLSAVQSIKLPIFDDLRGQSKIISLELEESNDSIAEESEIPYNMNDYDYSIKSLDKRSVFRSNQGISDKDSVCFSSSPSKNSINSLHQKSLQRQMDPRLLPGGGSPSPKSRGVMKMASFSGGLKNILEVPAEDRENEKPDTENGSSKNTTSQSTTLGSFS